MPMTLCLSHMSLFELLFSFLMFISSLKNYVWIFVSFVLFLGCILVAPSSKLFLMVFVYAKSKKFNSFSPNFIVIACVNLTI